MCLPYKKVFCLGICVTCLCPLVCSFPALCLLSSVCLLREIGTRVTVCPQSHSESDSEKVEGLVGETQMACPAQKAFHNTT